MRQHFVILALAVSMMIYIIMTVMAPCNLQTPVSPYRTETFQHSRVCDTIIKKYNLSSTKFVLSNSYWEQLTSATRNYLYMISYFSNLGAWTVQPFHIRGKLFGFPTTVSSTGGPLGHFTQNLDTIYNTGILQDMLCANNIPPSAYFRDFFTKADRELTILNTNYDTNSREPFDLTCSRTPKVRQYSEGLIKALNKEIKKHNITKEFTLKQVCCVYNQKDRALLPSELAIGCGFYGSSFSVVIMEWRGFRNPYNSYPVPSVAYPLSNAVLSNATAYYKDMTEGGKQVISIHFRTEKMLIHYESHIASCFDKTWDLVDQLKKNYSNASFKYFTDYGPYGSHTKPRVSLKALSQKPFEQRQITPENYRAEKYGGIPDQSFVALVEQVAIAKSHILVLVGGGSFQKQIRSRFQFNENGEKIYEVNCGNLQARQIFNRDCRESHCNVDF